MGCDIHLEVFIKAGDKYKRVPPPPRWIYEPKTSLQGSILSYDLQSSWPDERNYGTFGLLTDVRCDHGNPFFPPNGHPDWAPKMSDDTDYYLNDEEEHNPRWLDYGDHTYTHLTLKQLRMLPWHQHQYADSESYKCEFERVFIPMLEKIESFGVNENDIIVLISFDS